MTPDESTDSVRVAAVLDEALDVEWHNGNITAEAAERVTASLAALLADVVAQAKAEALREAADVYRGLPDSLSICAGHVTAELDARAESEATS